MKTMKCPHCGKKIDGTAERILEYLRERDLELSSAEIAEAVGVTRAVAVARLNDLYQSGKIDKRKHKSRAKYWIKKPLANRGVVFGSWV